MDTKTVDEILRKRGCDKLQAELDAAFAPVFNLLRFGNDTFCGIYDAEGEINKENDKKTISDREYHGEIPCHTALIKIKEAIFIRKRDDYERASIDEFIQRLDGLSNEFEELKNQITV